MVFESAQSDCCHRGTHKKTDIDNQVRLCFVSAVIFWRECDSAFPRILKAKKKYELLIRDSTLCLNINETSILWHKMVEMEMIHVFQLLSET